MEKFYTVINGVKTEPQSKTRIIKTIKSHFESLSDKTGAVLSAIRSSDNGVECIFFVDQEEFCVVDTTLLCWAGPPKQF